MIFKVITATSIIFLSLNLSAQNDSIPAGKYGVDYNITSANGKKSGRWYRVYDDGSLYYTGTFKDGIPEGEFRYYYRSGELMTIATHKDHQTAETVSYRMDGTVVSKGNYLNQKKNGEWLLYNEEGKLTSSESYKADSLSGVSKVYYINGVLAKEMSYDDNHLNGPWKEYFDDGNVKGEGTYLNDQLHGYLINYQSPKVKLYEGELREGLAIGEWKYYLDDGRVKLRILYDDNGVEVRRKFENGEVEEYYDSGIPMSYYEYKHGQLHGPFEEYYNKGDFERREVISTEPGQPIEWKETLVNTQLKREGEYRMGKLHGEVISYNEDGTVLKTEQYDQGELISGE